MVLLRAVGCLLVCFLAPALVQSHNVAQQSVEGIYCCLYRASSSKTRLALAQNLLVVLLLMNLHDA
jgi:hypothetical protein